LGESSRGFGAVREVSFERLLVLAAGVRLGLSLELERDINGIALRCARCERLDHL